MKQAVLHRALQARTRRPELFLRGLYTKLAVEGPLAQHALAFARSCGEAHSITIISKHVARLVVDDLPHTEAWQGTAVVLPGGLSGVRWMNALTDGALAVEGSRLELDRALSALPVALLEGG